MVSNDINWVKLLTCLLALVAVILSALIYAKVNKKCGSQNYIPPNRMALRARQAVRRNVKDLGPSAGGDRISNPPASFVSGCQNAFSSGCASGGATVNVCGGSDNNGNMVINCQDYTDMDDQSCNNASFVAYQASDCASPLAWAPGYLCGGGSGDPSTNPCPSGGSVVGTAPPNVYGCTNICQ